MELHQLRYLVTVVEEGSFTGAAARLHVSQSGVSAQLAKLEHELGQRLLDRLPRSLALTAAGTAVVPLARSVLAQVDQIAEVSDEFSGVVRGRVRLGMIRGCSIPPFLDALASFRADHPGVELVLAEGDSAVLQRQVLSGELDLALLAWAGPPLEGLSVTVVVDEPVAAVVPTGHPLARRRRLTWADLDGHVLLTLTHGTGVRAAADLSRRALGLPERADLEASSPDTVLGLVRRGAGVGLLSPSMVVGQEDVVAVVVRDAGVTAKLGLAVSAGRPASATRVLHYAIASAMAPPAVG